MPKRVLMTGVTGFIGANLARRLLAAGHQVHGLVRPGYTAWRLDGLRDDLRLHIAELTDAASVAQAVRAIRPEWVFHLAAYGASAWQTAPGHILQTNVMGTAHLLHACLEHGPPEIIVNTGSSSEYGYRDGAPQEGDLPQPNSHYALGKAAGTLLAGYLARAHQVPIPTLRLYSAYGPYETPRRLIPTLVLHGLRGTLPPLVNPEVARDFIHIDDVLDVYQRLAESPPSPWDAVYNVGTGAQTSLRQVVDVAREVFDIAAEPAWGSMPDRQWDTDVWVSDPRALQTALGWSPTRDLRAGLRGLGDWFRAHPALHAHYARQIFED